MSLASSSAFTGNEPLKCSLNWVSAVTSSSFVVLRMGTVPDGHSSSKPASMVLLEGLVPVDLDTSGF